MPLNVDFNVVIYVLIIFLMFIFVMALKERGLLLLKIIFKTVLGAVIIFLINFIGQKFNISIPLNIWTSACVGMLGIPGILVLALMKWAIF
ncbi:pro-sigmaK processing inhibitor BofA family protein [Thermobrachium celere]|uniref:pro-sigmaK processing inhibitor BofA family protein n=1 Tax=Thermobrachium celere TaxID=53422 RepID=UPI001943E70D|nr:pro-sigmaK processing inhibitor BofA family protein [Thermobrachium celere]GFR35552.1 hypothetical protein TCEA9_13640 [Thermobrachium celere]